MRKPSLYGEERVCKICGSPYVERHHVYPSDRRKISDREGCTVFLCPRHHRGKDGVHGNAALMEWFKSDCQLRWEEREGIHEADHETFRSLFGANYL